MNLWRHTEQRNINSKKPGTNQYITVDNTNQPMDECEQLVNAQGMQPHDKIHTGIGRYIAVTERKRSPKLKRRIPTEFSKTESVAFQSKVDSNYSMNPANTLD